MAFPVRRKLRTLWRYLWPSRADRAYLSIIAKSGLFDRDFYIASNPGLNPVFHLWPERHYVQLGEAHGCCPTPEFSPRAYLFYNPDLRHEARPFAHYIQQGGGAMARPAVPPPAPQMPQVTPRDLRARAHAPRVAVVLHLYYLDLWPQMAARLAGQRFAFDLRVTLTDQPGALAVSEQIRATYPDARVWIVPNHGRDIWPFVWLVGQGVLQGYDAVVKLHSKKSPHLTIGDAWRDRLLEAVLPAPDVAQARLDGFLADETAGLMAAGDNLLRGDKWWSINKPRAEAVARRIALDLPSPLVFPAGSMFWVKAPVLTQVAALALTAEDFEPEEALVEGTTAHALERLMGPLVQGCGLRMVPAV
ncbi:MAG: rhamnan synthesis F family protein [Paracoccaceae bacterium]